MENLKSIFGVLQELNIPAAYSHFDRAQDPPFVVYIGSGQDQFYTDNEICKKANTYQVEYYFTKKNEAHEEEIETALTDALFTYTKSADTWIDDQDMFVIYYDVARKGYYNE